MQARLSRFLQSGLAAFAAAAALLSAAPAQAGLVSFDYTGRATSGATVKGTFGWDTDAPTMPGTIGDGGVVLALYYLGGGFVTGQVSGGVLDGQNFAEHDVTWLLNDRDATTGAQDSLWTTSSPLKVLLTDADGLALSSLALPTTLDLSDWTYDARVRMSDTVNEEDFNLLSIRLSASPTDPHDLPEPGSLALLLLAGASGLVARRFAAR
ncbi:PEP-CTERM sorting domain-containing protein [Roseateles asaccharophilus]|uniref:PEP-CTERM protein-sorting domain-containing protein n=1 Tax=Roseateles asaccharophilus TaxID=582607 RepID=A0ABU2A7Q8_9BURK|nr:PEP-CTERM sorting domain-containing protein [Roseateles asaccharophilus]MDR7333175.1 hypothetical protein [Roseateles asaccharophilus]